ncbi:MAG: tetratricopeptide repeat protein [Planctomycetota bacterium]|nr:MAG: tetratricopeptide repeat protein [Planctomycetota bacterium]
MFRALNFWLTATIACLLAGCSETSRLPEPPQPDLSQAYPEVAEFLQERLTDVRSKPKSADAWGHYAMSLDAHEYHSEAIACYEFAIRLAPERMRWKYLLSLRFQEQEPEKAAELLMQVTQSERPSLAALIRYTDLLAELQRGDEHERLLTLAEKKFPQHPAVLWRRARLCFEAGKKQNALDILRTIHGRYLETTALEQRILAEVSADRTQHSSLTSDLPSTDVEIEDKDLAAVANYRRDPLWRGRLAAERANAGDQQGLLTLTQLVAKHPDLVENRLLLAIVLQELGDVNEARRVLLDGLAIAPGNLRFLGELGALSILESNWPDAEEWLRKLLSHHPESVEGRSDLAYVLEQSNRRDEALELLHQALKRRPDDSELIRRARAIEEANSSKLDAK